MENHGKAIPRDERQGTLVMAGILVAWGVLWIVAASQIPSRQNVTSLAPGFLPFWMGVILAVLAIILFLAYWRMPSRAPGELGREPLLAERRVLAKSAAMLIALLLYIVALPTVHYLINTFLLMAVSLALFGEPLKPRLVAVALAIGVVLFVVFLMLLEVPLPGSRFG